MKNITLKKIFNVSSCVMFVFVALSLLLTIFIFSSNVYAANTAPGYCKKYNKPTKQDQAVFRACKAAWDYGYHTATIIGPSIPCLDQYPYNPISERGRKYTIRYYACRDGVEAGKRATNNSDGDSSGSGGSDSTGGGGGSDTSPSGGGVTSPDSGPEISSVDGIEIPGAPIVAGEIKLDDADRAKTGLNNKSGDNILVGILNTVYSVASVVAVIVIIAAGLIYITSDGDPQKTERARKAIIYASAGLVIIGSAFIITGIIQYIGAPPLVTP